MGDAEMKLITASRVSENPLRSYVSEPSWTALWLYVGDPSHNEWCVLKTIPLESPEITVGQKKSYHC